MKHLLYKIAIERCLRSEVESKTLTDVFMKYGVQAAESELVVRGRLSQGFNSLKTLISIYDRPYDQTSVYIWDEDAGGWRFGCYPKNITFSELKAHISDKPRSMLTDNAWPFIRDMVSR